MLVLSRKLGEMLMIGDDIRIVVTEIQGTRVKLGIEAPMHMRILREEYLNKPARKSDDTATDV